MSRMWRNEPTCEGRKPYCDIESCVNKFSLVVFRNGSDDNKGVSSGQRIFWKGRKMYGWRLVAVLAVLAGVAVPEPSTLALLRVGAVALLGYRWRRSRAFSPMKRSCFIVLAVAFSIGLLASPAIAQTFITLDVPGATGGTFAEGISGGNIVGYYNDSTGSHGFLYDGSTYTTEQYPSYRNGDAFGISGNNIVGDYEDQSYKAHGFLCNGSTWATIDDPLGAMGTQAKGISGSNIVGYYIDSSLNSHGFLYNGLTYTTLDDPLATNGSRIFGISGNNIVGAYEVMSGSGLSGVQRTHGFLYDGSTWTTIDDPLAVNYTGALGISGGNIVGDYFDSSGNNHGFLYNGSTYITIDDPIATAGTTVIGIDGNTVVGYYEDAPLNYGQYHGFEVTIPTPEPSTIALLCVGAIALLGYRWCRRKQ